MTYVNISQNEYGEKIKKSSLITLGVVLFLIIIKAFAYFATGSIIILSLLADSFFDLIITLTTFILVRISLKKNTNEYRFGYGKAEALSAFIEGIVILLISIFILYMAYKNFIDPEITIINSEIALIVIAISIFATLMLVRFQTRIMKDTASLSVESEKLHYFSDLLTNIAAFVGIYMIYTTIAIFQKSIAVLIDREIDDDLKSEIFDIVKSHNKVLGFHDVRTRQSGSSKGKFFMQMHIEVSEHVSLEESHNIADQVEENILNKFPDAEIILHVDPSNVIEEKEFVDA
jgi:ferrous-iron efflux pump FieF